MDAETRNEIDKLNRRINVLTQKLNRDEQNQRNTENEVATIDTAVTNLTGLVPSDLNDTLADYETRISDLEAAP